MNKKKEKKVYKSFSLANAIMLSMGILVSIGFTAVLHKFLSQHQIPLLSRFDDLQFASIPRFTNEKALLFYI